MNLIPPSEYTATDLLRTAGAWILLLISIPIITYACLVAALLYAVTPASWTGGES